jgi:hypothetical protein
MAASSTLRHKLDRARLSRFAGREEELRRFRQLLDPNDIPIAVLSIHGPGGVGKTTLLDQCARIASDPGVPVHRIDARDIEASPGGVQRALTPIFPP